MDASITFEKYHQVVAQLAFVEESIAGRENARAKRMRKEERPKKEQPQAEGQSREKAPTKALIFRDPRLQKLAAENRCFICESATHLARNCPRSKTAVALAEDKERKEIGGNEGHSDSESGN